MQTDQLSNLISNQPMFADLEPRYIALLADCARKKTYHAGDYLFDEGKLANNLLILNSGTVTLQQFAGSLGYLDIETLGSGSILSWSWLIPPHVSWLSAHADSVVEVLILDGLCLRGKSLEDPRFGYEILLCMTKVAGDRLTHTRQKLLQEAGGMT